MSERLSSVYQKFFKDSFSEIYEIVRTVDVIVDASRYRIEIMKACHEEQDCYEAHYWVGRHVNLPPMNPEGGSKSGGLETVEVLVKYPYVWIRSNDPETVLRQALTFLAEGRKG